MLELLRVALVAEVPIVAIAAAEMSVQLLADTGGERGVVSGVDGVAVLAAECADVAGGGGEGGGGHEEDRDDFHLAVCFFQCTTEVVVCLEDIEDKNGLVGGSPW
ncbi:uncharacterized protein BDW47DRAFT_111280 [Aspergillus candidus]|uniref:Secreted protein n=1 Tax=Aspergillus candidus TaxID=41067 RepID=A0A2I2F2S0_ASPCN|nr:hypothetical protein BDW47DRAFT_111280 [Aspergillus candidus]PLB34917.1 hypothetical protein BDW47DRAFT_111280 [Aspergillus candidus]